jgi:pimeloyl-ACP methyl ester carboxylesterase
VAAWRVDLTDPDPEASSRELERVAGQLLEEMELDRLFLVGYSWGAAVSARATRDGLIARVLVAPPASMLAGVAAPEVPTLVLVPAHDQFGPPDAIAEVTAGWPHTTVEVVEGCDHFLVGAVDRVATRAVVWLT